MKRILAIIMVLAPMAAAAQTLEFGGRASVGGEWKLAKGLHLTFDEELRVEDNFSSPGSLRTSVGLDYKPVKFLKLGAGYTLINPWKQSAEAFNNPRHRAWFDVTGYLDAGDFRFSLKERLQLTHRTGEFNVYQTTPNLLALKSRAGVKYRGWKSFVPEFSAEVRTSLNEPWGYYYGSSSVNKSGAVYYSYCHTGYTHVYNNRLRFKLGADVKLGKNHVLAPDVLLDWGTDYEIDTNSSGTRLFSAAYSGYLRLQACISYTVKF